MALRAPWLFVSKYEKWLEVYPFRTKAISASLLMGSSDVIAQTLEHRPLHLKDYDFIRTSRMLGIGLCSGGLMHVWYGFLNQRITALGPRGAVAKVAMDQLLFAPLSLAVFFTATGFLKGESVAGIKTMFSTKYADALKVNYFIWPISMLINFRYVPPRYQVLWASTISLGWSVYLSTSANKNKQEPTSTEPK